MYTITFYVGPIIRAEAAFTSRQDANTYVQGANLALNVGGIETTKEVPDLEHGIVEQISYTYPGSDVRCLIVVYAT